jgi:hypothetical protein
VLLLVRHVREPFKAFRTLDVTVAILDPKNKNISKRHTFCEILQIDI